MVIIYEGGITEMEHRQISGTLTFYILIWAVDGESFFFNSLSYSVTTCVLFFKKFLL